MAFDVVQDLVVVFSGEGRSGGEDHMQQYPRGPDVAPLVVDFGDDFGSHVVGGAHQLIVATHDQLLLHVGGPLVGEPEVDEGDLVVVDLAEEEVLGLEVAVAYFLEVQVLQGFDDLYEYPPGLGFVEAPLLVDSVEKLPPLAKTASPQNYSVTRYR